jgi:hypothetical protein
MPTGQLVVLVIFGILVMAWGIKLDINNHRKEKAERAQQENSRA